MCPCGTDSFGRQGMSGLDDLNALASWLGLTCVCALSNLPNAFLQEILLSSFHE